MREVLVELADPGHEADPEETLRSLLRWVRDDESLTATVRADFAAGARTAPGQMGGGAFDLVQFAVTGGLSTASLVLSVLQWQVARRRAPALVLRRGELTVEVTPEGARDEETVRKVIALLDQQHTAAAVTGGDGDGGAA
ncbi:hypothetical protein H9Y04_24090 [Streptomyces sp. TRM66268-LWL]|uniref:Uncharacterized protein n=1 Tax=Streptomyces polyasparticus TaxID=2767826 RepID=A0ABR7SL99_9ACTN|nr:hypothetical protein [Streptomyces polyasparticus]MBC9715629.1 hypothetical protein [Streptomyces polyasparticus]